MHDLMEEKENITHERVCDAYDDAGPEVQQPGNEFTLHEIVLSHLGEVPQLAVPQTLLLHLLAQKRRSTSSHYQNPFLFGFAHSLFFRFASCCFLLNFDLPASSKGSKTT